MKIKKPSQAAEKVNIRKIFPWFILGFLAIVYSDYISKKGITDVNFAFDLIGEKQFFLFMKEQNNDKVCTYVNNLDTKEWN